MNALQLHNISAEVRAVADALDAEEDAHRATALAELENLLLADLTKNAEQVALAMDEMERHAAMIDKAAADLRAKATAIEKRRESLRHALLGAMERAGVAKLKGVSLSISVSQTPPAVVETSEFDLNKLDDAYVRVRVELDKAKALEDLKAGVSIPGLALSRRSTLRIR